MWRQRYAEPKRFAHIFNTNRNKKSFGKKKKKLTGFTTRARSLKHTKLRFTAVAHINSRPSNENRKIEGEKQHYNWLKATAQRNLSKPFRIAERI